MNIFYRLVVGKGARGPKRKTKPRNFFRTKFTCWMFGSLKSIRNTSVTVVKSLDDDTRELIEEDNSDDSDMESQQRLRFGICRDCKLFYTQQVHSKTSQGIRKSHMFGEFKNRTFKMHILHISQILGEKFMFH